jgi:glycosyltransferase involved in cell wall biosynthesis
LKIFFIPSQYFGGIGRDYSAFKKSVLEILHDQQTLNSAGRKILLEQKKPFFRIGVVKFYWNKKNQILLNAQFDSRRIIVGRGTIVQRLHDVFPITNPNWFTLKSVISFKLAFKLLSHKKIVYVANSEYTRLEATKFISKERILLHYCQDTLKSALACKACPGCRFSLESEYCLFVGTVEPRKNYQIVPAIAQSLEDLKLVIVGRNGWKNSNILQSFEVIQNVEYIKECCDFALDNLYRNCKAFISTSLQEGFNIPALEAHNRGARLILSDIPVHREVFGTVAIFCETIDEYLEEIKKVKSVKAIHPDELSHVTTLDRIAGRLN